MSVPARLRTQWWKDANSSGAKNILKEGSKFTNLVL